MLLTSSEDVVRFIGVTFERALAEVAARSGRSARLRFGVVDPDCVIYIDPSLGEVRESGDFDGPVTGLVAMAGDTALRYCQGRVDLHTAVEAGEIVLDGDCIELLEEVDTVVRLPQLYAEVLVAAGRSDLLRHELAAVS